MQTTEFKHKLIGMQNEILNFAYRLTSDYDDAHDLLQDTIYKALTNQDKYTDNTNFKGWVLTIAKNLFINNYRRQLRSGIINDTTDNLYLLNSQELDGVTPESSYTIKEIYSFIDTMSEINKIPFKMFVEGYKYDEIAEHLNIPLGTVKSRIFIARKTIQSHFKDYRFEI